VAGEPGPRVSATGLRDGRLAAGAATGVAKDTAFLTNDIYLVATKEMSDEVAYQVVKVLWDYNEELGASMPVLKDWRRERMVTRNATIPYHPGAIKFLTEKGAWTKEMDTLQAKLLGE